MEWDRAVMELEKTVVDITLTYRTFRSLFERLVVANNITNLHPAFKELLKPIIRAFARALHDEARIADEAELEKLRLQESVLS